MAFHDMPDRGPLSEPGIKEFADQAIKRSQEVVSTSKTVLDIKFGSDFYQKLDIYLPDSAKNELPVLLFMHGGAWRHGYKEWMGFLAPVFTKLPAIFVAVNYRLAPESKYPAALDDCFDALAWTVKNIGQYGGDPHRIFVGGHSAGGHYAALMGLKPQHLESRGIPLDSIKGCFPLSAPLELRLDKLEAGGRREKLIKDLLPSNEVAADASPLAQVAGNRTPFLVAWGSKDVPGIIADSKLLSELLKPQPGGCEGLELANCGHFDTAIAASDPECIWTKKLAERICRQPAKVT